MKWLLKTAIFAVSLYLVQAVSAQDPGFTVDELGDGAASKGWEYGYVKYDCTWMPYPWPAKWRVKMHLPGRAMIRFKYVYTTGPSPNLWTGGPYAHSVNCYKKCIGLMAQGYTDDAVGPWSRLNLHWSSKEVAAGAEQDAPTVAESATGSKSE
jgi:hypothetical protein